MRRLMSCLIWIYSLQKYLSWSKGLISVGGGGGGGGWWGGNLGVILVRVSEPVFQNLPHSYTWPLKKRTHSYTCSSKMLTCSYTALWFFVPIFCWLLHKYHSQFMLYQEDKQPRKISERKICAYTRMSEKWGLSHRNPEKSGHSYTCTFYWKKGANHIPGSAEKGGYSARTFILCHI